jgi:hypothetical protein
MTEILFTRSDKIGSKVIRGVTKEEVSHVAISYMGYVIHANFQKGVHVQKLKDFCEDNEIVYKVPVKATKSQILKILSEYIGSKYDYLAFFLLGLRLLKVLPMKVDIRQITGSFLCTEFVTQFIYDEERLLTPGQLYKELTK